MKKIKVLHIASFNGNIGDIGNHNGFRNSMAEAMGNIFEYTNLEMREFYKSWGLRKFDENFAYYANQFDLVVIGGGGFFEMQWEYSSTGTTVDLSDEILDRIRTPILFNCLSISDTKGVTEGTIKKFGNFLKRITSSRQYLVSVRNDGSIDVARKYYDKSITSKIRRIPDGGFFINPPLFEHSEIVKGQKNIAVNIAGDMPEIRYSSGENRITHKQFIEQFSSFVNKLLEIYDDTRFVFIPHIFKDYIDMSYIFQKISDMYLRTRVVCAPCLNGVTTDGMYNFDLYRKCCLTIGMRYHSNVCSIAMNIPTIGIVTYEPHVKLYEDINLAHRIVKANKKGFEEVLWEKANDAILNPLGYQAENNSVMIRLRKENIIFMKEIRDWLGL